MEPQKNLFEQNACKRVFLSWHKVCAINPSLDLVAFLFPTEPDLPLTDRVYRTTDSAAWSAFTFHINCVGSIKNYVLHTYRPHSGFSTRSNHSRFPVDKKRKYELKTPRIKTYSKFLEELLFAASQTITIPRFWIVEKITWTSGSGIRISYNKYSEGHISDAYHQHFRGPEDKDAGNWLLARAQSRMPKALVLSYESCRGNWIRTICSRPAPALMVSSVVTTRILRVVCLEKRL